MKEQCFDEGTIQAFLDGELASDMLENVARHIACCEDCSLLLQEAEEESSFAFAALDQEFSSLVPTERIRTNLYQAISEIEKPKVSFWEKIAGLRLFLSNPSITAFAGLLIVAGLFAVVWKFNYQTSVPPTEIAQNPIVDNQKINNKPVFPASSDQSPAASETVSPVSFESVPLKPVPNRSKSVGEFKPKYQNLKYTKNQKADADVQTPATVPTELLSGEETYLKTIATLKKTVDENKGIVLNASARVAFEKDLAIVNDAIDKMKTEVRKNPKNDVAKEVLRNSYQNKIDLLNSVAERSEIVAGLD